MNITLLPVRGIGEVRPGDDLPGLISAAIGLRDGDVVVVSSKVVSKAMGLTTGPLPGEEVEDARRRIAMSAEVADDVVVDTPHVVVVRTRQGYVCANAGIDASNVPGGELLLLPDDVDAAAEALRDGLRRLAAVDVAVIVSDTFGRAWREGQTDVALGVAGMDALRDERGTVDREGQTLRVTLIAQADQIAGAADMVRDKSAGVPVVVVRGLDVVDTSATGGGKALVRPPETDLFPHGRGWLARRLATGEGAPVRAGLPQDWEWQRVAGAAGGGSFVADRIDVADGLAAGRAEAALLDLGYDAVVHPGEGWTVVVRPVGGPAR